MYRCIVIVLIILIYYVNSINVIEDIKDSINIQLFNGLSVLFIIIMLYYTALYGLKKGLFTTFIIWCLFITATPIPEAGLLVSVPLKNILKIDLDTTQWVVSFVALVYIFYAYFNFRLLLKENKSGRFLLRVIDYGSFSIFITSIIASISFSYLLNEIIDNIIYKKTIYKTENIFYVVMFIVPFIWYFISLRHLNNKYII